MVRCAKITGWNIVHLGLLPALQTIDLVATEGRFGEFKMKKIMAALLVFTAFAAPAHAIDFAGKYKVEGTNINGTTYNGEATIDITSETTCEIHWTTGATTSDGICMRNDDSFAAAYKMQDEVGLIIYKVSADGVLNGVWTIAGNGGAGTEVLTPIK